MTGFHKPPLAGVSQALLAWVDTHAGLERLCQRGGWPDGETLRIDVCKKEASEWMVDIYFEEVIQEMSECAPCRDVRCGQFIITFDDAGYPGSIRLLFPM